MSSYKTEIVKIILIWIPKLFLLQGIQKILESKLGISKWPKCLPICIHKLNIYIQLNVISMMKANLLPHNHSYLDIFFILNLIES